MKIPKFLKPPKRSNVGNRDKSDMSESTTSGPFDLALSSLSIQDLPLGSRSCPQTTTGDEVKSDDAAKTEEEAKIENDAKTDEEAKTDDEAKIDDEAKTEGEAKIENEAKTKKQAAQKWVFPLPTFFKSDNTSIKSRLFSQKEHGYEVEDDCIADLRRLSSDSRSVVILVSGYTNHTSDGPITYGSGVFFSPTSQLNIAQCVSTNMTLGPLTAELYAVFISLSQLEDSYVTCEQVEQVSGTVVGGWEEVDKTEFLDSIPPDLEILRVMQRRTPSGFEWRAYVSELDYVECFPIPRRLREWGKPDYSDPTKWKKSISFSRVVIATECEWIIDELCFGNSVAYGELNLASEHYELFQVIWRIVENLEKLGVEVEFWWVDKESTKEASILAREGSLEGQSSPLIPNKWLYRVR
jgi:hypothetical protein